MHVPARLCGRRLAAYDSAVSSSLTVHPARVEDVAQMARVNVRCWQETYRGLMSNAVLDDPGFLAARERFWTAALTDERYPREPRDGRARRQKWVLQTWSNAVARHGDGHGRRVPDRAVNQQRPLLPRDDENLRAVGTKLASAVPPRRCSTSSWRRGPDRHPDPPAAGRNPVPSPAAGRGGRTC
jgi:hypothetical protein